VYFAKNQYLGVIEYCTMRKLILITLMLIHSYGYAQTRNEQVASLLTQQELDWNNNDLESYAGSFSEDGTLINFLGLYWKGKTEIIKQFQLINECCIKPTQIKLEILDTYFLSETAAIAHIRETLTAKEDYQVPGKVVKKGSIDHKLITAVLKKEKDAWKILSMQVTQVVPMPPR
jgi:uncharacterized protein (TIGR02246 family)